MATRHENTEVLEDTPFAECRTYRHRHDNDGFHQRPLGLE